MRRTIRTHLPVAFTLIELLIVVAIIAILAAIAVPNFLEAQVRSKVSRAKSDMRSIVTALESYMVDNNMYPDVAANTLTPPIKLGLAYSRATLVKLSTPIAYMSNGLLTDPFAVGSKDTSFYGYCNAVEAIPFLGAVGATATPEQTALFRQCAWVLQSVGPDGVNFALQQPVTNMGFTRALQAITDQSDMSFFYDATNGTVSVGDIVRTAKGQK